MLRQAPSKAFIDVLMNSELLPKEELSSAISEAKLAKESVCAYLTKNYTITSQDILELLSKELQLSVVKLRECDISKTVIDAVPVKFASYYKILPTSIDKGVVTLATSMPLEMRVLDEIRVHLGLEPEQVLASEEDIEEALKKYYGLASDTIDRILTKDSGKHRKKFHDEEVQDIERQSEDPSVTKLVNQIILEAFQRRATDIHIEPYRHHVRFRYRVDGSLIDANLPPEAKHFLQPILSRIKIMANLSITEKRLPQDGSATVKTSQHQIDLRVSTIPTQRGESMVIRILPSSNWLLNLEKLGFNQENAAKFRNLIKLPHGVIFVTGPTGSGKTTTLYACLNDINRADRKIITIEDPIEYEMEGVTQIQINPGVDFTFAKGLRSILRHDPDIIMVGEVRDAETAEIAIRTALTGHLVFSTLHTNDASSGVTRLIDMGVEPYLVSSSIEAFVAQRLVRVICSHCKQEDQDVSDDIRSEIARSLKNNDEQSIKIYKGCGCDKCNHTGYYGRTAIYEILEVNEAVRNAILEKPRAEYIKKIACQQGMRTLRQDGWNTVAKGVTTVEEVLMVTVREDFSGDKNMNTSQLPASISSATSITHSAHEILPEIKEVSEVKEVEQATQEMIEEVTQQFQQKRIEPRAYEFRAYPRVGEQVPVIVLVTKTEKDKPNVLISDGDEIKTKTCDISGAGLKFLSPRKIDLGTIVEVKVDLNQNNNYVECLAKVCRIDSQSSDQHTISAYYLDISNNDRVRVHQHAKKKLAQLSAK